MHVGEVHCENIIKCSIRCFCRFPSACCCSCSVCREFVRSHTEPRTSFGHRAASAIFAQKTPRRAHQIVCVIPASFSKETRVLHVLWIFSAQGGFLWPRSAQSIRLTEESWLPEPASAVVNVIRASFGQMMSTRSRSHWHKIFCLLSTIRIVFGAFCVLSATGVIQEMGRRTFHKTNPIQTYRSVHICQALSFQEHIRRINVCVLMERIPCRTSKQASTVRTTTWLRLIYVSRACQTIIALPTQQSRQRAHARLWAIVVLPPSLIVYACLPWQWCPPQTKTSLMIVSWQLIPCHIWTHLHMSTHCSTICIPSRLICSTHCMILQKTPIASPSTMVSSH